MFLSKEYHISLSEIRKLEYFRYEWLLEEAKADVEKQKKDYDNQQKEYEQQRNSYKMPKYSPPKMPTYKMPKF